MNLEKLQRKSIAKMRPYESSIVVQTMCKLDQNESPYDVPPLLKDRIIKRIKSAQINRYPDLSYQSLRKIIAKKTGVKSENVAVGSGVDDLLYCLSLAYLEKNDRVVYATPTFGMYRICCEITDAKAVEVPLGGDFSLPKKFLEECSRAKIAIICRPNNPTCNCAPLKEVERIVKACPGLVCIDEAYVEFADDNCMSLLKYENVVIMRTLSKAFSAAGARVGYALADRRVIEAIDKVRLPWNLSVFSQIAAEELLQNDGFSKKQVKAIKVERKRMLSSLKLMGAKPADTQANFILFRPGDAEGVFRRLLDEGVLVRKFSAPAVAGYLRVSVGTRKENDCFLSSLLRSATDAVFFDIDDTLVEVSGSYLEAIRRTAEKLSGRKVPAGLVGKVKSMEGMNNDWDATVEVLRRMGKRVARSKVVPIFQNYYFGKKGEGLIRNERALFDARLAAMMGKKIGIVTGRPRAEAKIALQMLGFPKNTILVAMEDAKEKPDPAPLLLAKKLSGSKFPIYIGDSASDRLAAARAGMGFVAIGKGGAQSGEYARFSSANQAIRRLFL